MVYENCANRASKAIVVKSGTDRFGSVMEINGWRFECKLSGRDTGGDYCVYDTVRSIKGGPPLHVHREQDEWFYIRSGLFAFQVGNDTFRLGAGDTLFGPRGVPHTFAALTETSALIVAFQPAGAIEDLFTQVESLSKQRKPTVEDWREIAAPRGVDVVGPPLSIG